MTKEEDRAKVIEKLLASIKSNNDHIDAGILGSKIKEGGKPVAEAKGVKPKNWHNGRAELEIGSGNYTFTVAP